MTRHERFWDRVAVRYAARPVRDPEAYERTLARAAAHLSPVATVVEFGCGTGTTALRLAPAVARLDATDFSTAMVAIAREKTETAGAVNVAVSRADLFDPDAVPGPYDAALAFNFLQLTPDLPAALDAVSRRLKPGGLFISKTVCLGERGWRAARLLVGLLKATRIAPPLQFHSIDGLDAAMAAAGFDIIERGVFPQSPPARFLVARKVG